MIDQRAGAARLPVYNSQLSTTDYQPFWNPVLESHQPLGGRVQTPLQAAAWTNRPTGWEIESAGGDFHLRPR